MIFELHINSENAAFDADDGTAEVRELVAKVAQRLLFEAPPTEGAIFDSDGNRAGEWRWMA